MTPTGGADERQARLRALPSIDRLLGHSRTQALLARYRRSYVARHCRDMLAEIRSAIADGGSSPPVDDEALATRLEERLVADSRPALARVVNATGTILHTNLGRALLPLPVVEAIAAAAMHPLNLEYDLERGERGRREEVVAHLLGNLTGAEAATAVNNNAAAVLLCLNTFAAGREVLVSRGELIEIGGAFRLPDIMARSGAILREVGTTNRTHPADYESAITANTALILKVHTSNYRIVGFSAAVDLPDLVEIGRRRGIMVMEDLGSGALIDLKQYGLPAEPVVGDRLALGADVVTFSGDKMLGGPQAGLIAGGRTHIDQVARNPLHRALRCGKLTIAALEATLRLYQQAPNVADAIPALRAFTRSVDEIAAFGRGILPRLQQALGSGFRVTLVDATSQIGSGALPTEEIPSKAIVVEHESLGAERIAARFRAARPPIVGRINEDRFLLDLRAIFDADEVMPKWGVIIGTAGHIDHGKTSLVKALTGQDTDRLKEEKERGISIDLGFAYLDLPDGSRAGLVDVPGHERFIRNMLAGAHGIDVALFTVAADDGVMPQTEEHFDIVHLLRVPRLLFVLTKVDLVGPDRRREVEAQIAALVAGTGFEGSPVLPCSSVTGEGLAELRARIEAIALEVRQRAAIGWFRLPVDRVFVLQGHGVVVTGTAVGGQVRVGDRVRCLPGDEPFRVRSLHVHNAAVQTATAGQRVALNLGGAERPALSRGDVICDEALTRISDRFDASIEVRPAAGTGLKDHQRVRVHIGTAERLATVRVLGSGDKLKPRDSGYCQIVLVDPVQLMRGDRFILRDETASRTIGGGIVVSPWARQHKRSDASVLETLAALSNADPLAAAAAYLDVAGEYAVPVSDLAQFMNMQNVETTALADRVDGVRVFDVDGARVYMTAGKFNQACRDFVETLRRFHADHPLAPGMDTEAARPDISVRLFRAIVDRAADDGIVVREGSMIRLPEHKVRLNDDQQALVERIEALLARDHAAPPAAAEMESTLGVPRARIIDVLRVMERGRMVVRVAVDLYFRPDYVAAAESLLRQRWRPGEEITPAAFRDAIGTSRKYAIPLLEYFDRIGVTERNAAGRRLKNPARAQAGSHT